MKLNLPRILLLGAGAMLIAGCAAGSGGRIDTRGDIDGALNEETLPADDAAARAAAAALMPQPGGALGGSVIAEPRFDVIVDNADARAFFMSLVKDTAYNVVVHPAVKGRVSLPLKNVTVPETMAIVRDVYGYDFRRTANGYMVLP